MRIAIDEIGTGYSSLSDLQRFPVDALKIDRSFLSQLADNPEGETLLRTLVQLGKALSIETLAEGIERDQEFALLQEEDCDSGQGYLFARLLDAEEAARFLRQWPGRRSAKGPRPRAGERHGAASGRMPLTRTARRSSTSAAERFPPGLNGDHAAGPCRACSNDPGHTNAPAAAL